MKVFKYLDLFGTNVSLYNDNSRKYKTQIGAIFSSIYGLILILILYGFGEDFYYRINPSIIYQNEISNYEIYNLSNSNFTFAFRIEFPNASMLENHNSYFNFKLTYAIGNLKQVNLTNPGND